MPRRSQVDINALDSLAHQQDGLVLYRQLAELGFPASSLAFRIRAGGPWQRLLPGVYLTSSGTPTRQQQARAALLYAGNGALLTGAEALARHELRNAPRTTDVQVLVPVQIRDVKAVRAIVGESVQQGFCPVEDLLRELREGPIKGSATLRRVLAEVRDGVCSAAEGEARDLFLHHGLPQPRWNVDVYTENGDWVARPDGWYEEQAVAFEVDSREWHLDPASWDRTMRRHMRMAALGIVVLHVTPNRIRHDGAAIAAEVRAALDNAVRRPRPLVSVHFGPAR